MIALEANHMNMPTICGEKLNFFFFKGDYVIVDPIEEGEKVKAEISFILYKDHVQYLQKQQLWWVRTRTHARTCSMVLS